MIRSVDDRVVHAAAWLYAVPRIAKALLVLGLFGLAAFMIVTAIVLNNFPLSGRQPDIHPRRNVYGRTASGSAKLTESSKAFAHTPSGQ